jgi:hypothetical protein
VDRGAQPLHQLLRICHICIRNQDAVTMEKDQRRNIGYDIQCGDPGCSKNAYFAKQYNTKGMPAHGASYGCLRPRGGGLFAGRMYAQAGCFKT